MGEKTWLKLLLSMAALAVLASCGGGGSTVHVQNQPAPAPHTVTIAFQPKPPSSITINQQIQATAVVQNDSSNAGVDWSVSCPPGNCGTLNPLHTPSGQSVTYTPPAHILGNSETVNITAFASADETQNVRDQITVTAFGSVLGSGNYVIGTSGSDSSGLPYQRAGVITLDGNGGIITGEQTVNAVLADPNTGMLVPSSVTDAITGGSYFVGYDGRGELVINTNDVNIGQTGVETFDLVVLSSSHLLLSKLDDPSFPGASNEVSTGTMDLQSSAPQPSLGYAFVARGTDVNFSATGLGGVLNIDSPMAISGAGSAFDFVSPNINGAGVVVPSSAVSGTVTTPDGFGAFQISVATDFGNPITFTAYPIDGTHAKLIESDGSFALTAGDAYSQGASTGTYHGTHKLNGNYVFGIFGTDLNGGSASLTAAGLFSTTGVGTLTNGFIDESQEGDLAEVDDGFQATYAVGPGSNPSSTTDPAGTGRYYIPVGNFTFAPPFNGSGPAFVFYMISPSGPALILDADTEPSLPSPGGGVGIGIAYPVAASSPILGGPNTSLYGTTFTQNFQGAITNVIGEITANNNTLSGLLDFNGASGPQSGDTSFALTLLPGPVANRFHGPMSDMFFTNDLGTNALKMAFYPIDSTQGFFLEHDVADNTGAPVSGVVTFGTYFQRTPVCQGCP